MSARFGLWVVLLVVALQPLPLAGAQTLDEALTPGRQLMRRGDYVLAREFYAAAAPTPLALLQLARAELADGDTDAAEATLQGLFATYPDHAITSQAMMLLAQVRRAAGNCGGAIRALDAVVESPGGRVFGPYPDLQRAMCFGRSGEYRNQLAAAQRALSIDGGGPRLTRIEVLEEAAEASLKLGSKQEALDFYNRCLELAGSRGYRAEMLFTTATLARALGQDELATERFRAVVVDFSETARASAALDALAEMERHASVSPLHGGLARLNAREYSMALASFNQVGLESPDWGAARFATATTLIRAGREDEARPVLRHLADSDPAQASRALLQLGQLYERSGDFPAAEATYLGLQTPEAWYRIGFVRYVGNDRPGALAAFQSGLNTGQSTSPAVTASLLYWSARLLPPGSAAAEDAYRQAAQAAPESYHGLRANDAVRGASLTAASLGSSLEEQGDWAAWLLAQGSTPERLAADLAALPGLWRADDLLELGMRTEATWEVDGVMRGYIDARDVAHLSGLANWLQQRDVPHLVLLVGRQQRELVGLAALPHAAQKQVYPAGWGDLVEEYAARHGLDPLLVLALMRQESSFDPRAQSSAQAMGLMQVIPSTARSIASRLGYSEFVLNDLYRPSVSLEFGSWFLRQVLREFDGRPFPALAAYNAGGGNVSRWLARYGDDPDVLVELVPFTETRTYLRVVYENYAQYRRLYGG